MPYDTRYAYHLPVPQTNSMKCMFFHNAANFCNDVTSERDFVCFSSTKNFRRSYFDLIMAKFIPDAFRID